MAERKLRFQLKIEGKEAGVVSAITPPIDVPEIFRDAGARAGAGDDQWISVSFVADTVRRSSHDAGE